ncbi:hypothetical protein ABEB36_001966 [Hypothenemus hampei]|uniref:Uncharacterized protein n=1 Tax=Hypothenemus hampei TaxID=57062 RepID=A0ABD1FGY7_HYPHA
MFSIVPIVLAIVCVTSSMVSAIVDLHSSLLPDKNRYPSSSCCIISTCQQPEKCYATISCGYLCSTGRYPPAETKYTPGYRLKVSYSNHDCKFKECKYFEFSCKHCPDPLAESFSIETVRDDCKNCYYRVF